MKQLDGFLSTMALEHTSSVPHSLPWAPVQEDPIAFLSFSGIGTGSCASIKSPYLSQVKTSAFRELRICSLGAWSGRGHGLLCHSCHPILFTLWEIHIPLPQGWKWGLFPLLPTLSLPWLCGLLWPTSHLQILPVLSQAPGSMPQSIPFYVLYPCKFTSIVLSEKSLI